MTTSQVFYRKWRPQRFEDVAGQRHVTTTLRKAIASGRVSHAYLFTGPRGVGKTSTARILAKALNCLKPAAGEPDNTCANCVAALQDKMLDLIEIDAASNRGIDDIRKLRDNTAFSAVSGGWKVYIIDEVHMLTDQAANALLKTLEEPPPKVVMVLATTDAHKVPVTIVSRCQRFDFRRLSNEDVTDRLAEVCGEEGIECEPEVLEMIARQAWGSLRDAENLLEQLAVSYGGLGARAGGQEGPAHEVTADNVRELLGAGNIAAAVDLAEAVLAADPAKALEVINREAGSGADLRNLKAGTVEALRTALLLKAGVESAVSQSDEVREKMRNACKAVPMERLLAIISAMGQSDVRSDSSSPLALEISALRAIAAPSAPAQAHAAAPAQPPAAPARARPPAYQEQRPPPTSSPRPGGAYRAPAPPHPAARRPAAAKPAPAAQPDEASGEVTAPRQPLTPDEQKWARVTYALRRTKTRRYILGALLKAAEVGGPEDGSLVLKVKHRSMRENIEEELRDPKAKEAVEQAVLAEYGAPLKLIVRAADGEGAGHGPASSATESPMVRAALAMGARVVSEEQAPD
jgi:DNA polymerase-3 subunit gamma/tau